MKRLSKIGLKVAVWKEGQYYIAQCLNVDVSSFGDNKKEALKNLDEALELYFEDADLAEISSVKGQSYKISPIKFNYNSSR